MMDAVGKKYAIHEIISKSHGISASEKDSPKLKPMTPSTLLTATFRFVPLRFFENHDRKLKLLTNEGATSSILLEVGAWLVTTGDGLMEACSIAYLFKHLPMQLQIRNNRKLPVTPWKILGLNSMH
jgi:hypothetical protein